MPSFFAITGPMGVGKTTLVDKIRRLNNEKQRNKDPTHSELLTITNMLHEHKPFQYVRHEPLDRAAFQFHSVVDAFYDFRFSDEQKTKYSIILSDYSAYENTIYRQTLENLNLMTKEQSNLALSAYLLFEKQIPRPDRLIYIKASPDFIMNNVIGRNRIPEVTGIDVLEIYIEELVKNFNSFMEEYEKSYPDKFLMIKPYEIPKMLSWLAGGYLHGLKSYEP